MDLLDLEKLLEAAKIAEKIVNGTVDESVYNVIKQTTNIFEQIEDSDMNTIIESCKDIKPEARIESNLDALEDDVNTALGIFESTNLRKVAPKAPTSEFTSLVGKKVLLKNATGQEFKAMVESADAGKVVLKGKGGGTQTLSSGGFKKVFVKAIMEQEEMQSKKAMPKVKPTDAAKKEPGLKDGIAGTDAALGKETSPVDDVKEIVEIPDNKVTIDTAVAFKHAPAVEQSKFVSDALKAKKAAVPSSADTKKLPKNEVDDKLLTKSKKLLENADKFKSFVNSIKDDKNSELVDTILEAFEVVRESAAKKISK